MRKNSVPDEQGDPVGGRFIDVVDTFLPMFFHLAQPTRWRVTFGLEAGSPVLRARPSGVYISDFAMRK